MLSIRSGVWETNSSTLHQFTICLDDIKQNDEPTCDLLLIQFNDKLCTDDTFKAEDIQDRLDVIVTYAISTMVDCIAVGDNGAWTMFNDILNWLYLIQKMVMDCDLVTIQNFMSKNRLREYVYGIYDRYKKPDYKLVGSDMFYGTCYFKDGIMSWPLDNVIKFIINDESYFYQEDHACWDEEEMPNNEHFKTIFMEE